MTDDKNTTSSGTDNGAPRQWVEEPRVLEDLIPFPGQADFFGDVDDPTFRDLIDDIDRRGLQNPPEVLPENAAGFPPDTILLGHRRVRALIKRGDEQHSVIVRYDLAEAPRDVIEHEFLMDNLARRQMSKLAIARVAKRLIEIERATQKKEFTGSGREIRPKPLQVETRDVIGKRLGFSGRTLDRWMQVLDLPMEIQRAVEAGALPTTKASDLASMPTATIKKIATAIGKGEDPRKVVARHMQKPDAREESRQLVRQLITALKRATQELPKQLDDFSSTPYRDDLKVLGEAEPLIKDLKKKLEANEAAWISKMEAMPK